MVPIIYDSLLLLMLYVLYRTGKAISKNGKIMSSAGVGAILIYTLNEGLRFGRGIDYNLYGKAWDAFISGKETTWSSSFLFFANIVSSLQLPWQCMIMLMSFAFILGTLILLRETGDVLPLALPIFCVLTLGDAENLLRWYTGFSFIMIGMYFLIRHGKKFIVTYLLFSIVACSFHLALIPIPILIFILYQRKKILFSPAISLSLFFIISLSFKTELMMRFAEMANVLSTMSVRFEYYSNNLDYWLTGGNDGIMKSALPDIQELIYLIVVTLLGYRVSCKNSRTFVFFYNLYLIGLFVLPVGRQIELIGRFDAVFLFFRAVITAYIVKDIVTKKITKMSPLVLMMSLLIIANITLRRPLTTPFKYPERFLYIWDSEGRDYDSMVDMWLDSIHGQYEGE